MVRDSTKCHEIDYVAHLGNSKNQRILKLHVWFKSNGDFSGLGRICLVTGFNWEGSVTNGATLSSSIWFTAWALKVCKTLVILSSSHSMSGGQHI